MEENKKNSDTEGEVGARVYEVAFIVSPAVAEENLGAEVTALKDVIAKEGGVFIAEEFPRLIDLAYKMERTVANKKEKFTNGYFGWVKFDLPKENALALDAALEAYPKLVRHLMIKTVRENTMAAKQRPAVRDVSKKRHSEEIAAVSAEGTAPDATPEEIDKQIDALVTE